MRHSRPAEEFDLRARLAQVDQHVTAQSARREPATDAAEAARPAAAPARIVPVPRRGRVFLRGGDGDGGNGHGSFAPVTLMHPVPAPRPATDVAG